MSNFKKANVDVSAARSELHELLNLTGAEISINTMPGGTGVPFVHRHIQNEEIYGILSGKGVMNIDGEDVEMVAGDWLRVDPVANRQLRATEDMTYVCIQAKAGSLEGFTGGDAVLAE